jgi:hypothetical protein
MTRANTASITVGSASAATATSRLDPMPPNALPESSPARARKKVPSMKSDMSRMIPPANDSAGRVPRTGTTPAATSIVATSTKGVKRKIHEVAVEITTSFRQSFARSA